MMSSNAVIAVDSGEIPAPVTESLVTPPPTTPPILRVLAPVRPLVSTLPAPPEENEDLESEETDEGALTKLNFKQVNKQVRNAYVYKEINNSMICDIIAMYLKGQKILYTEAKTVCEQRLNYLMMPCIFTTAVCTILSLVLKEYSYGPTIVSSLNGFTAFILAVINYLKLDAKAEAHRVAAYKFDKLQSYMEFNSGKILFDPKASNELVKIIQDTENNVREIKETNQFILPEKIRYDYPNLYNMNVFSEVKKISNRESMYVNRLKDVMNSLVPIYNGECIFGMDAATVNTERLRLEAEQKQLLEHLIRIKDDYLKIDQEFEKEMKRHRERIGRHCDFCGWLKT
jgi:hypothetical protein